MPTLFYARYTYTVILQIFKKGDPTERYIYIPISILPTIFKFCERTIRNQIRLPLKTTKFSLSTSMVSFKAFDTINYKILIRRLQHYNSSYTAAGLIKSYSYHK